MNKEDLKKLIDVAAGRELADTVIKNCKIVDVYNSDILQGDIAICNGMIAGIGEYSGKEEIDANGYYASPGLIDSHIHIESSYLSPEELGRLLVPNGGTTIIADPHELVNVCGIAGLDYMIEASKKTSLDIKFVLPSCVPATPFEHAGAIIDAKKMEEPITREEVIGLGEFMNYPGVINADDDSLDKLLVAINNGKLIDGHCPNISDKDLNAYIAPRILTEHECSTVKEMIDRVSRGVYVLLRQGSACHDLENLLPGVTTKNSRRLLLCSDDRQPKTILELGHLNDHLRICVRNGIDPITAIQMGSLNAAECFRLYDRGAIAPGLKADIVLFNDLEDFKISQVFIDGKVVAENGDYLPSVEKYGIESVGGGFKVKDFSKEKLNIKLNYNHVYTIDVLPGGVLTSKGTAYVDLDDNGYYKYDVDAQIAKVAVVERHQNTGNVALGLLKNYGIKNGAIAVSIAHDSHNIIVVGRNDEDIELAVNTLIEQDGGIVLTNNNEVVDTMPMPIGGIMSDKSGEWVNEQLTRIHNTAHNILGVKEDLEPIMVLSFMSLAVIPELKLTDMGLFDVGQFKFIDLEIE